MKTISIFSMLFAWSAVTYAQQSDDALNISRDKKGIVQSIEFPDAKQMSYQEFLKEYLP